MLLVVDFITVDAHVYLFLDIERWSFILHITIMGGVHRLTYYNMTSTMWYSKTIGPISTKFTAFTTNI